MADERFYEQKLTNILIEALNANHNCRMFIQASDKQTTLIGMVSTKIERLIGVDGNEAKTYINYATGQFKPGRWMPHCLDPELKDLFSQLETTTKEVNKYPFKSGTEARNISSAKMNQVSQVMSEIKNLFGELKAKDISSRAKATAIKITGIVFWPNRPLSVAH